MSLAVLKFGGTSVGDANAIRQSATITRDAVAQHGRVIVITSAMGKSPDPRDTIKVTDMLLDAAKSAAAGDGDTFHKSRRLLADKHHTALNALVTNTDDRRRIGEEIDQLLNGFEMLCASVRVLGEVTPRAVISFRTDTTKLTLPSLTGARTTTSARLSSFRRSAISRSCLSSMSSSFWLMI